MKARVMEYDAMADRGHWRDMTEADIIDWLRYWQNARMVNVDAIRAFDQVNQARQFCECTRAGEFAHVSDLDMWRAIRKMRGQPYDSSDDYRARP